MYNISLIHLLNPITLNILRLRAKTKPQIKRKRQQQPKVQMADNTNYELDSLLFLGKKNTELDMYDTYNPV